MQKSDCECDRTETGTDRGINLLTGTMPASELSRCTGLLANIVRSSSVHMRTSPLSTCTPFIATASIAHLTMNIDDQTDRDLGTPCHVHVDWPVISLTMRSCCCCPLLPPPLPYHAVFALPCCRSHAMPPPLPSSRHFTPSSLSMPFSCHFSRHHVTSRHAVMSLCVVHFQARPSAVVIVHTDLIIVN